MRLRLTGHLKRDDEADVFVAYCPELKIYSQGVDQRQAMRALKEAAQMFLENCDRRGILEQTLTARGFSWEEAIVDDNSSLPFVDHTPVPGVVRLMDVSINSSSHTV